jgi:signal transduction histidine kinase
MLAAASYGSSNAAKLLRAGDTKRALEASDMVREALDEAMGTLRESLVDLRRSSVEAGGLVQSIRSFGDQLSTVWGANIVINDEIETEPPISVALAAYQIVQEALVNALKHAGSDEVRVNISQSNGAIVVVVEDDGGGFDPTGEKGAEHVGMKLMKERAAGVGGTLEIASDPDRGTSINATLPAGVGT